MNKTDENGRKPPEMCGKEAFDPMNQIFRMERKPTAIPSILLNQTLNFCPSAAFPGFVMKPTTWLKSSAGQGENAGLASDL
jgi:hypothetical protein